jgi:cytochrome c
MMRLCLTVRYTLMMCSALAVIALMPATARAQDEAPETDTSAAASAGEGGEEAFNNACRTCHSPRAGDHRLGPSLVGIVGRKAGSVEEYSYSPSLKNSRVTFDEKTLDAFIANPDAVLPGNNMKPYSGITDAGLRAKIIAYLKATN